MCSVDIPPNRLTVAQEAAETLIRNREPGMQIGIVAFAGFAELIAPPTSDEDVLLEAVRKLIAGRRTAVGSAILRSIDAIAEINDDVAPTNSFLGLQEDTFSPMQEGEFHPDIIVLLTDGASNRGINPLVAAQAAVDRGLHVYTIGYGTELGGSFICTPEQLGNIDFGEVFGGGFLPGGFGPGSGGRFRRGLDEETLQQIAMITDAEYYLAESADDLLEVFADVPSHLTTIKVTTEISAIFTGLGALIAFAAVVSSQRWHPLP
jgi:Ca-activated chloride channel family protein